MLETILAWAIMLDIVAFAAFSIFIGWKCNKQDKTYTESRQIKRYHSINTKLMYLFIILTAIHMSLVL